MGSTRDDSQAGKSLPSTITLPSEQMDALRLLVASPEDLIREAVDRFLGQSIPRSGTAKTAVKELSAHVAALSASLNEALKTSLPPQREKYGNTTSAAWVPRRPPELDATGRRNLLELAVAVEAIRAAEVPRPRPAIEAIARDFGAEWAKQLGDVGVSLASVLTQAGADFRRYPTLYDYLPRPENSLVLPSRSDKPVDALLTQVAGTFRLSGMELLAFYRHQLNQVPKQFGASPHEGSVGNPDDVTGLIAATASRTARALASTVSAEHVAGALDLSFDDVVASLRSGALSGTNVGGLWRVATWQLWPDGESLIPGLPDVLLAAKNVLGWDALASFMMCPMEDAPAGEDWPPVLWLRGRRPVEYVLTELANAESS
ncbi:hypothetical protein [Frondihabitans peucedani]|uniref:Uncharacterized protein n=1 Tax=Frondihabitans peucedani TaxID=598626 RepID=A0ABP8E1C1_9MICO